MFSRPETFGEKLKQIETPFPANNMKKKGLHIRIKQAMEKRKKLQAFINSGKDIPPELLPKKVPYKSKMDLKIFKREPDQHELREIEEL
jgi:hypothetical protein